MDGGRQTADSGTCPVNMPEPSRLSRCGFGMSRGLADFYDVAPEMRRAIGVRVTRACIRKTAADLLRLQDAIGLPDTRLPGKAHPLVEGRRSNHLKGAGQTPGVTLGDRGPEARAGVNGRPILEREGYGTLSIVITAAASGAYCYNMEANQRERRPFSCRIPNWMTESGWPKSVSPV